MLTLGYSGRRGLNLSSLVDYNLPLMNFNGTSLEVPEGATRFNPLFREINYASSSANAWWGEPVGAMLGRVLVIELSQRLPNSKVYSESGAITGMPRCPAHRAA